MPKKVVMPEDFDMNEILGNKSEIKNDKPSAEAQASERRVISRVEDIDEKALLDSMASINTNDYMFPKKKMQMPEDKATEPSETAEPIENNVSSQSPKKPVSGKQRKADLRDYRQAFLSVPKITDRKTVFISNELRERIIGIVRRFGTEKSSVSGFIENLVIQHLEEYQDDIESWKKL
ncbi:MAG: DUF3408 domain-containing protein [Prevotella sp.]|jgi:hypothetical protein|nr:DUF3408 domain-containing protein [Prevotella sp.]